MPDRPEIVCILGPPWWMVVPGGTQPSISRRRSPSTQRHGTHSEQSGIRSACLLAAESCRTSIVHPDRALPRFLAVLSRCCQDSHPSVD